jgi:hypothetical protein
MSRTAFVCNRNATGTINNLFRVQRYLGEKGSGSFSLGLVRFMKVAI